MFEKITFFIFSNRGSPVKRATVSKAFLRFLGLLFAACLIFVGYIVYDYYHLKNMFIDSQGLQSKVAIQSDEIVSQRKQIQTFANEINGLKAKLVELNTFENKIRIIANLEKTAEQKNLFGVGGSIPDDLDGKDYSHAMLGENGEKPDATFFGFNGGSPPRDLVKWDFSQERGRFWRAIRTSRYIYVVAQISAYAGRKVSGKRLTSEEGQVLFDLQKDPYQTNPIYPGQDYDDVIADLHARLSDWLDSLGDKFLEETWED